ncbi:MAG: SufD family Fe-S cluster assembly protein [Candidatus Omnitrophica bacterium]|nr:SufD family Fe-S cluster assembly protein [Candidatus Omnitrophota bacterium]
MSGQDHKLSDVVEKNDREDVESSGMDLAEEGRSASFLQQDEDLLFSRSIHEGVEVLKMEDALKKYPQAEALYGKAFGKAKKEYPPRTSGGYFIRARKGQKIEMPVQACLYLKALGSKQRVHNLIVVEEGAELYLITGCAASKAAGESFHLGVSEFFVEDGGYLNFTMIHSWREDVSVRPMSVAVLGRDANFISNYVCLKPVSDITMYPTALLEGASSRASFNSLIISHPDTVQDIGARVVFRGEQTKAEIVSRAVSYGGKVIARGHLKAEERKIKGHLECRGLVLTEKGIIHAVPELETDYRDVDLSHEAAIGKISRDEIEYLRSRGMSPEEAQSVIIRGFMDIEILSLPPRIKEEIEKMEEATLRSGM